ncbi:MAG: hypothetical protein ACKN9W_04090 [Methylococcus sp.]
MTYPTLRSLPVSLAMAGVLFLLLPGVGAQAEEAEPIKQEWEPSTLSDKTLTKINAGLEDYQKCLNEETQKHVQDKEDSRKLTDLVLRNCEPRMTPIKAAFDAEKVPGALSDRYLRAKRSRAAQQVVKVMMQAQAARYSEPPP